MTNATVLSQRTLNRTSLERQLLLSRVNLSAVDTVRRLVGLQAQHPNGPYLGLWTRLEHFHQEELTALLYDRQVVRSTVLRGTQHLVTAEDFRWLRPMVQPALNRGRQGAFGRVTAGIDLAELAEAGRALLREQTLTRPQLGKLLTQQWPQCPADALAWSVQCLVPVVHAPPNGTWGKGGATPFTLADQWLDQPLLAPDPERLITRYLAAFGPGSVMDIQTWSGLTRLREVIEPLRPGLRVYRDEAGRELFDLPDATLADEDAVAPVRFLPEFDNVLIAHADRTRIMTDEHRRRVISGAMVRPTILVDGMVRGLWSIQRERGTATLVVEPFTALSTADRDALAAEGSRLLAFAAPEDVHEVGFAAGVTRNAIRSI